MKHPPQAPLHALLTRLSPIAVDEVEWPGAMRLAVAAYATAEKPPAELVSSVRCIVQVGDDVLVYEDSHPSVDVLPGGRCEPGETWPETARREVLEETGWRVDPTTLSQLGFIHFRHLTPVAQDHPFPNPDFLQVVLFGEGHGAPQDWVDVEGYVVRSWLLPIEEALGLSISAYRRGFLALLVR